MSTHSFKDLMNKAKEAGGFENIPAGNYIVKCVKSEATQSSTGKDMIKVQFEVQGGPHAGSKLFNNYTLSPENANAIAFWFRHMKAFGMGPEYFSVEPSQAQIAATMQDRIVAVKVGIKNYMGEDRNEVTGTMPAPPEYQAGASGAAPTPPADPFAQAAAGQPVAPPTPAAEPPATPTLPFVPPAPTPEPVTADTATTASMEAAGAQMIVPPAAAPVAEAPEPAAAIPPPPF